MNSALILVVEDDSSIAEDIRNRLKGMGYEILVVHTGEDAIRHAGEIAPDLLLIDINLQGNIDGVETAAYISSRWDIPLIYLTDYSDETKLEESKATSPMAYLTKPLKDRELQINIEMALRRHRIGNLQKASEEKYKAIFENSRDAIFCIDEQGTIVDVNHALENSFGYKKAEVMDKHFAEIELAIPEMKEEMIGLYEKALAGKLNYWVYSEIIHKDGRRIFIESCHDPIKLENGKRGILVIMRDVTRRKEAEQAIIERNELLNAQNEQLRAIEEYSPEAVARVDRHHRHLYVNAAQAKSTGIPQDEWIGKTSRELGFPKDICTLGENAIDEVFRTGKAKRLEISFPDGQSFDSILSPELDTEGKVKAVISSSRDITARKQIENELRQSREALRASLEASPYAIGVMNLQGIITYVSPQTIRMFGYENVEEMLGRNLSDFVAETSREKTAHNFQEILREGISRDTEYDALKKDGTPFAASISAAVIRDVSGKPISIIGFTKDITDRKRAEEEEARSRALEELDRMKTALLASVSHELRTPLTSIKGLASTLLQPDVSWDHQTQQEFLYEIDQAANRLTYIVSDLIDMSQLEAGTMRMENMPIKLSTILNKINRQLTTATQKHKFEIKAAYDLPIIDCDEVRIGHVITNLVSNAASYSDEGTTITLEARRAGEKIEVSVTDRGIGIAQNELERVFDRFYRLETGVTRRRGGSGLGLSICKGIIERHGGKIWAESHEGKGSRFTFTLPAYKIFDD
ncbi:MAG: PAS domain S-box protein [Dehalococcoidia bacterium]